MHIEILRDYCLSKKGVEETLPFGPETLVFKVMGKVFCLTGLEEPNRCNLKCDPEYTIELRQTYEAIQPGYHMDKKHWNTVVYNSDASDKLILSLVDHSYDLVVKGLTKKLQLELASL